MVAAVVGEEKSSSVHVLCNCNFNVFNYTSSTNADGSFGLLCVSRQS